MPDMTKEDPEPEADTAASGNREEKCGDCGHAHAEHDLVPGSRSWFWAKRVENLMLWLAPGGPLLLGVVQLISPSVTVDLGAKDEAAVNGVYNMPGGSASTAQRVTVYLDHPGIADRLVAAGPSLLFAALLAFVAYALWRIEINLSATGRYTPKDGRVLRAATRWLWRGFWVLVGAEVAVTIWFRHAPHSRHWWLSSATTPFDNASLMVLMVAVVVGIVGRIYRSGAKAYKELEGTV